MAPGQLPEKGNGTAVAAGVAGILSLLLMAYAFLVATYDGFPLDFGGAWLSIPLAFFLGIFAMVAAATARDQVRRGQARSGAALARLGFWLGTLPLVLMAILTVFYILLLAVIVISYE